MYYILYVFISFCDILTIKVDKLNLLYFFFVKHDY